MSRNYRLTENYEVAYPNPIKLRKGDLVKVIKRETNPDWLGWVFCVDKNGIGGWVSETYLDISDETAKVVRDYEATELATSLNEVVEILYEEFGWAWVRNRKKEEGWLPTKILEATKGTITVRDLSVTDVPQIVKYWFHSPAGFVEGMGVDLSKLPTESEMLKSLTEKCQNNALLKESKINALVIENDGAPVGFHTLFPFVEGDHGIFHAHIWNPQMRGRGVAVKSYLLAAQVFMDRFNLTRILYKTPFQNVGSIRLKEKLGIRHIGEETIGFGIIKEGTRAKVFELTRDELNQMVVREKT